MVEIDLKDSKHSQLLIQKVCGALWSDWKGRENETLPPLFESLHSLHSQLMAALLGWAGTEPRDLPCTLTWLGIPESAWLSPGLAASHPPPIAQPSLPFAPSAG